MRSAGPTTTQLSEKLRDPAKAVSIPHRIITQLPFASVVTTNYDKLLERAYASVGDLPKTPTHRDTVQDNGSARTEVAEHRRR